MYDKTNTNAGGRGVRILIHTVSGTSWWEVLQRFTPSVHPAPSTQHPAPSTQHPAPSTQHRCSRTNYDHCADGVGKALVLAG
ncbi:hypothetical protein SCARD494_10850 [Seiridium cardinale]